jgi:small subunit ribosomal protein S8
MYTDPLADLLTRLRNASAARHVLTHVPASRLKREVLQVLKEKARIADFSDVEKDGQKFIQVSLIPNTKLSLKRISSPGQRIYRKSKDLFPVLKGYGLSIVSTSQGVMTGDDAKAKGVGGEVLCEVY